MSVKTMTAEAIRKDLNTIMLTWPNGVPWQQVDRVNALKAELKRRGESLEGSEGPARPAGRPLSAMTTEELETELRALSVRGEDDEEAQERFASVRYELRSRAKGQPEKKPQVPSRVIEMPDEDDAPAQEERVVPRRPTVPAAKIAKRLEKKPPTSVCGYTATGREDGSVLLEYEVMSREGSVIVARVLEGEQADDFAAMLVSARLRAKRMQSGE